LDVKLADPSREGVVMIGDGSFLMLNSAIATLVAMGLAKANPLHYPTPGHQNLETMLCEAGFELT
jgi:TPP-dependent trihydroxycyclohexane-1,2-dione (THcHDO) dehydratase